MQAERNVPAVHNYVLSGFMTLSSSLRVNHLSTSRHRLSPSTNLGDTVGHGKALGGGGELTCPIPSPLRSSPPHQMTRSILHLVLSRSSDALAGMKPAVHHTHSCRYEVVLLPL